jgi:hypothetical protein
MANNQKNGTRKSCVQPEILEAAKAISELKGENLDALEAAFYTNYVHENLHVLTEKARQSVPQNRDHIIDKKDGQSHA